MKVEVNLILITFDSKNNTANVLLDKRHLPKMMTSGPPLEVVSKISEKYVKIEPQYIKFDIEDVIYKDKKLVLLYSAFMPSPVPIKKGDWHIAWEVFREDENTELYQVVQKAVQRAFQGIQVRPYNLFS